MAIEVSGALLRFERELADLLAHTHEVKSTKSTKSQQNGLYSGHNSGVVCLQQTERAAQSMSCAITVIISCCVELILQHYLPFCVSLCMYSYSCSGLTRFGRHSA